MKPAFVKADAEAKRAPKKRPGKRGPDKKPRKKRTDKSIPPRSPGRPRGSRNVLPLGAIGAIRALRHRVPECIPEPLGKLADEALVTVAMIMLGEIKVGATTRLMAARVLREEICGPIATKLEVSTQIDLVAAIRKGRERARAGRKKHRTA